MDRREVRTRIYSQFSEVRFSSVALAAAEETGQHLLKGQGRYIGVTHRQRRRTRSAGHETSPASSLVLTSLKSSL